MAVQADLLRCPDPHVSDGLFMLWCLNVATLLGWLLSSISVLSLARSPTAIGRRVACGTNARPQINRTWPRAVTSTAGVFAEPPRRQGLGHVGGRAPQQRHRD